MVVNCQIPGCKRRGYKSWARIEMYLPPSRNCKGTNPRDGHSLKNPTQKRKSQFQKLAGHKPASNSTGILALSGYFFPLPPTILSLFTTSPWLWKCQKSQLARWRRKSGSGKWGKRERMAIVFPSCLRLNCSRLLLWLHPLRGGVCF